MMFTVGYGPDHDKRIADGNQGFEKRGKEGTFKGSFAFETIDAARAYLAAFPDATVGYKVYALAIDPEHTEQLPGEPFRRTLRAARVEVLA